MLKIHRPFDNEHSEFPGGMSPFDSNDASSPDGGSEGLLCVDEGKLSNWEQLRSGHDSLEKLVVTPHRPIIVGSRLSRSLRCMAFAMGGMFLS
jgi:hypothetical protein